MVCVRVCVSVCGIDMYTCIDEWLHMHMRMHTCGEQWSILCLQMFTSLFVEVGGSLTEPIAYQFGKASWPASSEMPLSAPPQVFIGMHNHIQPFHLYWESELGSFCLHTRHFTHWGIYLTTSLLHSWFQSSVYCPQTLQISNKTSTNIGIWLHQTSMTIK